MKKVKTITCMAAMMLLMMPFHAYGQTTKVGDINGDGKVTVSDVLALVQIVLKEDEDDNQPTEEAGEAIDLGLPSGIKWASCNVGATKPEEYGGYYAWGETEEKETYTWENYIHCDGTEDTCHDLGGDISGTEYDAAHVKWGGKWRIPTLNDIKELIDNCIYESTTYNGVKGVIYTSTINNNWIFMPTAGDGYTMGIIGIGSNCAYWSSTLNTDANVYHLDIQNYWASSFRFFGHVIRPVTE